MSRIILIPVHNALKTKPAITHAVRSSPDVQIELLQLIPSDQLYSHSASQESGESESTSPSRAAVEAITDKATRIAAEYDTEVQISQTKGRIGPATVEYASSNPIDQVVVGIKSARLQTTPNLQEDIDTIARECPVAKTVVRV